MVRWWLLAMAACTVRNPDFCPDGSDATGACIAPGDAAPLDAPDAPPGETCFGRASFTYCIAGAPTAPLQLAQPMTIETSSQDCTAVTTDGSACVLVGTDVTISARITAIGTRPLIVYATHTLTVTAGGVIDVSATNVAGPAANLGCTAGMAPGAGTGGGGGAGGSFGSAGGPGGAGGGALGGTAAAKRGPPNVLEGGCDGGAGAGTQTAPGVGGGGGPGGGAVLLVAEQRLEIAGTVDASGAGGISGNAKGGGGGGGSGGLIVITAPTIVATGTVFANGGGGGAGAGATAGGNGASPTAPLMPALGGMMPGGGAAGGNGAYATTAAAIGEKSGAGGGGGGGGVGVIRVLMGDLTGAITSPPPVP